MSCDSTAPEAVRKATEQAKRGMVRVPLRQGRTLHHDIVGHFGAGRVLLRSAPPGTGIIAGGPMRAVCEALASIRAAADLDVFPTTGRLVFVWRVQ